MTRDIFEFPATPTQEALWFIYRMDPGSSAYNIPVAFRMSGPLDEAALQRAFAALVKRHEILRTVFAEREGRFVQRVTSDLVPDWQSERVAAGSATDEMARAHAATIAAQPFNLEKGPLVRMRLERYSDTDALLVIVFHHIIIDHLSLGQCMRELSALYLAFSEGRAPALPDPEFQFADYAVWLREHFSASDLERKLARWRKRMDGFSGVLELPTDAPRPALQTSSGAELRFSLDPRIARQARAFARIEGVSLFTVMLAALELTFHRITDQNDVIVGVPFANRGDQEELEKVVGCFINTLPVEMNFESPRTFRELVSSMKSVMLETIEDHDVPLESIVDLVQRRRDPARNPLFQVGFVLQAPPVTLTLKGLQLEDLHVHSGGAMYDLHFWLWETEEGIDGLIWYNSGLFSRESVHRLVDRYQLVAGEATGSPDLHVHEIPVLLETERESLNSWNSTDVEFERGLRMGDLIRRQVESNPDGTAVVFEGKTLTNRELDRRAREIALRLRSMGVIPGSLVGVCLERSLELVTALVGIVYSGGAWVPLDPSYPPGRLASMVEDAAMPVVISRELELRQSGIVIPADVTVLMIDEMEASGPDSPVVELVGTADDPAYVIFTSGSTGRPKGAINSHRGIVNRLLWMQREYGLTPADRVLQKTPYSFDVSVWEFFWPLMSGATLVVAKPGGHSEAGYLVDLIRSQRVTVLHFVPSMLRFFLDHPEVGECGTIRRVFASGEVLPADIVKTFFARLPTARLANLYGPTEAAIDVSYWECRPDDLRPTVPIGRPVANTQLHVLDRRLQRRPIGCPGELFIGGAQVGMGYVSRPDLTAANFVDDPFSVGTLYRTGDMARWLGEGVVEFLGRADHQIKIRGMRIELGEIEAVLLGHPAIAEAVVMARDYSAVDTRLVAYVRFSPNGQLTNTELRQELRVSLPDYMIPQLFVEMDSMPLSPSGKIDRGSLPDPLESVRTERAVIPPRTPAERRLAEIWRKALTTATISSDSNFFEIGGHSLLAMQVIFHVEKEFGVRFNPRDLILNSLEQLAARLPVADETSRPESPARGDGLFGKVRNRFGR